LLYLPRKIIPLNMQQKTRYTEGRYDGHEE